MPKTFEGTEFTGHVTVEAASLTGLKAGTPIAAGGGDQAAQAVGVGAVEPGIVGPTVGTSGVVFATTPSALIEPKGRFHAFCHAVPDLWHFMCVMLVEANNSQITFQFITRTGVVIDTYTLGTAPTATPTFTPTGTSIPTLTSTPTITFTPTETGTPTVTPLPSPTPTDTLTPSATSTPSDTPSPTDTFTPSATPVPSSTPSLTDTPIASATPTPTYTATYTRTPTNTPTPTPSSTAVADLVFFDGFESGNLSAWSSYTTDGGDLSVSSAAALTGSYGLQVLINDNDAVYVSDRSPNAETRYRGRFYFDPNSISMTNNDAHYLIHCYTGTSTVVLRIEFRFSKGTYQLRAALRNDSNNWTSSSWFTLADTLHFIEADWRASTASGANNGSLTLWIDGAQRANLTGVDNDTRRIDRVQLGAVSGIDNGTRGTYYFDAFESRRQTYIGP